MPFRVRIQNKLDLDPKSFIRWLFDSGVGRLKILVLANNKVGEEDRENDN